MQRLILIFRQRLIGFIFLLAAISGGVFIYVYMNNFLTDAGLDGNFKAVFVASEKISKDQVILNEQVAEKNIPVNIWNEKYFSDMEDFIGSPATADITEEEILSIENVKGNLIKADTFQGFSNYIPKNLRAVSIPVIFYGETSLLRAGDRVDILSIYLNQGNVDFCAETILQKKEIIFINKNNENSGYDSDDSGGDFMAGGLLDYEAGGTAYGKKIVVLTFFLTPDEAECIFLALERGFLNISVCPGEK